VLLRSVLLCLRMGQFADAVGTPGLQARVDSAITVAVHGNEDRVGSAGGPAWRRAGDPV